MNLKLKKITVIPATPGYCDHVSVTRILMRADITRDGQEYVKTPNPSSHGELKRGKLYINPAPPYGLKSPARSLWAAL